MGKCQFCLKPTKKKINRFCSIECKSKAQSGKREKPDETKQFRCKLNGKLFDLGVKQSGYLKKYSKSALNKEYDENDWEIIDKEPDLTPKWNCPYCDWICKCNNGKDNSGQVGIHLEKKHGISKEDYVKNYPNDKGLWTHSWTKIERVNKINEHDDNRVQCQECLIWFKKISNSHLKSHGLNEFEYKARYGQDSLSSIAFRKRMSDLYYQNEKMQSKLSRSKYEDELCNFLKELKVNFLPNHKKFGFDLDIYLPDNNLAIEFNGLYFHSEYAGGKTEFYHVNKTKKCENLGIQLIHIFEDEWVNKKEIVISRLRNILGKTENILYARKCEIKEIDYQIESKFIDENHIQGSLTNAKVKLGLFHQDELVSVMTFGKPRISLGNKDSKEGIWELQRFCNKIGYSVVGGASKLFTYFEKKFNPNKVETFADRRWTSNVKDSLYDELGFIKTKITEPNYWYLVENMKRSSRFAFTKKEILRKFKNANPDLSEWKNMIELGFDRIWDCGSLKYEKIYDKSSLNIDLIEKEETPHIRQIKRRRKRKETTRNIQDVECKICFNSYSIVGIASHFNLNHGLSVEEYVEKYEEYRPLQLQQLKMLEEAGDKFQCRICKINHASEKALNNHIKNIHNLEKLEYIIQEFCNGTQPLCKCGCGEETSIRTCQPYIQEFVSGHNSRGKFNGMFGRKHGRETKEKMSKPRTKWSKK